MEEDFVEEFGRDRDELAAATDTVGAPVDQEDVGRAEAFSFAPDKDRTGALDSLGGWYTCGGGGAPTISVSLKTAISSTGFIASASPWSKIALSFELGDMSPPVVDISPPAASLRLLLASFCPVDNVDLALD